MGFFKKIKTKAQAAKGKVKATASKAQSRIIKKVVGNTSILSRAKTNMKARQADRRAGRATGAEETVLTESWEENNTAPQDEAEYNEPDGLETESTEEEPEGDEGDFSGFSLFKKKDGTPRIGKPSIGSKVKKAQKAERKKIKAESKAEARTTRANAKMKKAESGGGGGLDSLIDGAKGFLNKGGEQPESGEEAPKSNTLLYVGIGVGSVILIIILYMVFKPKKA